MHTDPIFIPRSRFGNWASRYSAWGLSGRALAVFLLLLVLGSLIGSFYLNQASKTTAAGLEIARLTREREYWRQVNADLLKQIAHMESLARVEKRSAELGFVKPEAVEYLLVQCPPLENSDAWTAAPPPWAERASVSPPTAESADWWGDLVSHFQSWMSVRP